MNYQTYVEDFVSYMYTNFSGIKDKQEIEKRYQELIKLYPNYYTICDNNLNFLFIDNFQYTPEFLEFLSNKIDLNFIGGPHLHSPLTYHFYQASLEKKCFFIGQKTDPAQFIEKFEKQFYNYLSFRKWGLESTYIENSYNTRLSINALVLKTLTHIDYAPANWEKTINVLLNEILKLHVQPEVFYINDPVSLSSQFITLMTSLPYSSVEDKKLIFNYFDRCLANKIDWNYKNTKNISLAYEFIDSLVQTMPCREDNNCEDFNKWKEFADFIIYDNILSSGFSFYNEYRKKESLYYYIENFWLRRNSFDEENEYATAFYKELLEKSKIFEERLKLEDCTTPQKNNSKNIRKI